MRDANVSEVLLLVSVAAALLAALLFVVIAKTPRQLTPQATSSSRPSAKLPASQNSTKTYTSPLFRYSIQYPESWTIKVDSSRPPAFAVSTELVVWNPVEIGAAGDHITDPHLSIQVNPQSGEFCAPPRCQPEEVLVAGVRAKRWKSPNVDVVTYDVDTSGLSGPGKGSTFIVSADSLSERWIRTLTFY